jgi:hypothetical protein
MKFEVGEEYPTRGGGRARVLRTDDDDPDFPLEVKMIDGPNAGKTWWVTAGGRFFSDGRKCSLDLIAPADAEPEAPASPFKVGDECLDGNGRRGRIVAIAEGAEFPVVWLRKGSSFAHCFRLDGTVPWNGHHLVPNAPKPRKVEGWANVYQDGEQEYKLGYMRESRAEADAYGDGRIACVPITFEVPE